MPSHSGAGQRGVYESIAEAGRLRYPGLMAVSTAIPVIDLFAGPGGLGEGFTQVLDRRGNRVFRIALSIEMDPHAHRTLRLRSFFRQFPPGEVPQAYYEYLKGDARFRSQEALFDRHQREGHAAAQEAWQATLGETAAAEVSERIEAALAGYPRSRPWVMIGGPPCQAYSLAGRSRMLPELGRSEFYKDKRHTLYREYLRLVRKHRPTVFIMENVKGLLSSRLGDALIFDRILRDLRRPAVGLEYNLVSLSPDGPKSQASRNDLDVCAPEEFLLRAESFGIPQCRHRLIIVGIRKDFATSRSHCPGPIRVAEEQISCRLALGDLPPIRSALSRGSDSPARWLRAIQGAARAKWIGQLRSSGESDVAEAVSATLERLSIPRLNRGADFISQTKRAGWPAPWFADSNLGGVCNHESRSHIQADLWRYLFATCFGELRGVSPKMSDFPSSLLPQHANIQEAINDGKFSDRFRVQVWDRPATTVTAHISKDGHYFIHPDRLQVRSLTVREAARLQTFPDNYRFEGPRTEQYRQVGNAVPPLLAYQVACSISTYLNPGSINAVDISKALAWSWLGRRPGAPEVRVSKSAD